MSRLVKLWKQPRQSTSWAYQMLKANNLFLLADVKHARQLVPQLPFRSINPRISQFV